MRTSTISSHSALPNCTHHTAARRLQGPRRTLLNGLTTCRLPLTLFAQGTRIQYRKCTSSNVPVIDASQFGSAHLNPAKHEVADRPSTPADSVIVRTAQSLGFLTWLILCFKVYQMQLHRRLQKPDSSTTLQPAGGCRASSRKNPDHSPHSCSCPWLVKVYSAAVIPRKFEHFRHCSSR